MMMDDDDEDSRQERQLMNNENATPRDSMFEQVKKYVVEEGSTTTFYPGPKVGPMIEACKHMT